MNSPSDSLENASIPEFYADKTILLTGGTGYMGKLLIEKLLRSCPNLKEILVLIRPKKNKSVEERIAILRNNDILKTVREIDPNLPYKIKPVAGDLTEDYLGLNADDLERVTDSVNIFFHLGAAAVFNAKLKFLIDHNISGVNNAINVAHKIKNLNAFINVSSLFSVYNDGHTEEKIYPTNHSAKSLMDLANGFDEQFLEKIAQDLKNDYCNTYAYTKAVADNLIEERCQQLPVGIFRPPGVGPLFKEPIPGWIDYIGIINGITLGMANGMLRIMNSTPNTASFVLPGDYVINCLITIGWAVAQKPNGIKVYNYNGIFKSSMQLWANKFTNLKYPLEKTFRFPSTWIIPIESEKFYDFLLYVFHSLPARVWDYIFSIFGLNYKLASSMEKLNVGLRTISVFHKRNLIFQTENTGNLWKRLSGKDKQIFYFDLNDIDWNKYIDVFAYGMKTITLKEDMANVNKAVMRRYWLMFQHYAWIIILLLIGGTAIYKLKNKL